MTFDEYQTAAVNLAIFPESVWDSYLPLQLASEAGEVAAEFAKPQRKGTDYDYYNIALELGDVLWYTVNLAERTGFTLEEIMQMNLNKLEARRAKNGGK